MFNEKKSNITFSKPLEMTMLEFILFLIYISENFKFKIKNIISNTSFFTEEYEYDPRIESGIQFFNKRYEVPKELQINGIHERDIYYKGGYAIINNLLAQEVSNEFTELYKKFPQRKLRLRRIA